MSNIIKANYELPFFQMFNEAAQDPKLSAQAKGVLACLLSLPPSFKVHSTMLHKYYFSNGRDSIRKAFNELVEQTYILKKTVRGEDGKFDEVKYIIYPCRYEKAVQLGMVQDETFETLEPKKIEVAKEPEAPKAPEAPEETKPVETIPFKAIIDYLNEKTGRKYHNVPGNQKWIRLRWNDGYRLEDFKTVIDNQVADWTGKTFTSGQPAENYLKPTTLFGSKFDEYLNNTPKQQKKNKNHAAHPSTFAEKPKEKQDDRYFTDNNGRVWDTHNPAQMAEFTQMLAERRAGGIAQ